MYDAEAEAPILWPYDVKSWLTRKDPDSGKYWRQKEKGAMEDEMVRQYYWLSRHESEQTLGDSRGRGSLVCCNPWGCKELDTIFRLNSGLQQAAVECTSTFYEQVLKWSSEHSLIFFHFTLSSRNFLKHLVCGRLSFSVPSAPVDFP